MEHICLNCSVSEKEMPLVTLAYRGEQKYICAQCFPLLIHKPEKLVGRIDGAENFKAAQH